jgi:predicted PurR-regulated permease PerM
MFQGLFHALAFAAITAASFYPLHLKIKDRFNLSKEIAATVTTFLVILLLVIPLIYIVFQISKEGVNLYANIRQGLSLEQVQDFFFGNGALARFISDMAGILGIEIDLKEVYQALLMKAQSYSGKLLGSVNAMISDTLNFFFQFLIMILALFTLFVEGEKLKAFIFKLSPLPDEQEQIILEKFSQMNFVTLICNGIGGLIQGGLAGVGMAIAGFSSIFLWSTVMVLLAFIPLVGISIITIPASIYLLLTGKVAAGITFFIFTTVIALVVENWFKPKFMGSKIQVNSLLLLFYIIAGMGSFGMAGIFYGPIVCILFLTMVDLFETHYVEKLN